MLVLGVCVAIFMRQTETKTTPVQDISAILAQARTEIDPDVAEDDDDLIGFHVVLKNDDAKNE